MGDKSKVVSDKEYDCPICLSILIEPVTMPCNHSLCMPCYMQTVEKANLACPICRLRISVWARKSAKNNTLVDRKKWSFIQKNFPDKVNHRLDDSSVLTDSDSEEDNDLETYLRRLKELSEPGEIRQEYEAALEKLRLQKEEEARKEEEASRALIEALQAEEISVLETSYLEMEEIEKIDRQKALEIHQEQLLLSPKLNGHLQIPPGKKYLKIGNVKKTQQNKVSTSSVTLNKFFAAVPHQALSPLPLSERDCCSQSKQREKSSPAHLTPGVSDFCWSRTDENCEEGHVSKSQEKLKPEKKDVFPGPSGLAMVKRSHLTESFKANVDFNSASYQPIVRCEKNQWQKDLFYVESRRKSVESTDEFGINSFIGNKECRPPKESITANVEEGRVTSRDYSAAYTLDKNEKTDSFKTNVDFNSASYQPIVRCEKNLWQKDLFYVESRRKSVDSTDEFGINSFIGNKECQPPKESIPGNVEEERVTSRDYSAADTLDKNEKTTSHRLDCSESESILAEAGLKRNAKVLNSSAVEIVDCNIVNNSSVTATCAPERLVASSPSPTLDSSLGCQILIDDCVNGLTTKPKDSLMDECVNGLTTKPKDQLMDDCVNGLITKPKDPLIDDCVLEDLSCNSGQDPYSSRIKQKTLPPKTKGKRKGSASFRQKEERNTLDKYIDKTSAQRKQSKSLMGLNTLDSFVKSVKRGAGDLEQPCSKRQKNLQPDNDLCLTQEEEDRLYALKLQEMYQFLERKNITVDRFEGSGGEYSLRKKHKS